MVLCEQYSQMSLSEQKGGGQVASKALAWIHQSIWDLLRVKVEASIKSTKCGSHRSSVENYVGAATEGEVHSLHHSFIHTLRVAYVTSLS